MSGLRVKSGILIMVAELISLWFRSLREIGTGVINKLSVALGFKVMQKICHRMFQKF
jgi:hypothetical protein